MMITFSAFRTAINTLVFPDGQAETRVPLFRNFIVNALIQLQTFVESYQLVNVNFYDKDQSWDDCGLSILQGCRGRIGAVYAFKPSCRCQRHFYDSASLEKLSCLYEHCRCHQTGQCCCGQSMFSEPSLYVANPYYCGDYVSGNTGCQPPYLAATPEDDCGFKLSEKFFAVGPNQKIWLFPRFPCGYVVGVHWRGIRRSYLDNDYVPDDDDLKDAVACYVESEVARRVDKDQATADRLYADYRMKAGDIIFREEQDLKPRATRVCVEGLDLSELVQIYPDNNYPTQIGESCATSSATAPVELDAPVMTMDINSESSNKIINWAPEGTEPETYEIWRSVNGAAFAMVGSVAGNLTTFTDTTPMASMDIFCYKVRGVTGDVESEFSNEGCAVKDMFFLETGAVSHPTWMMAFGDFGADNPPAVTSLDLRGMLRFRGNVFLDGMTTLGSFNLDSLIKVDLEFSLAQSAMPSAILPSLTAILVGDFNLQLIPNMVTLSAPVLTFVGGNIDCPGPFPNGALVTVNLASFIMSNGRTYSFDNNALSAASVNHILARGIASGVTSATIDTSGGTAAGPSGQGTADKSALIIAGNSVTTN